MLEKQDLTAAKVRIEAMLGEATRSLNEAEDTLMYYRKEYERAKERWNAARDAVDRLTTMHHDCERIQEDLDNYRNAFKY